MHCPNCSKDLGGDYRGDCCHGCGHSLGLDEAVLSCSECGTELGEDGKCSACKTKATSVDRGGTIEDDCDKYSVPSPSQAVDVRAKATMLGLPTIASPHGSAGNIQEALSRVPGRKKTTGTVLGGRTVDFSPEKVVSLGVKKSSPPKPRARVVGGKKGDNSGVVERRKPRPRDVLDTTADDNIDYGWAQRGRKRTVAVVLILLALFSAFMFWWSYIRPH